MTATKKRYAFTNKSSIIFAEACGITTQHPLWRPHSWENTRFIVLRDVSIFSLSALSFEELEIKYGNTRIITVA
jgi:hypothetical protein